MLATERSVSVNADPADSPSGRPRRPLAPLWLVLPVLFAGTFLTVLDFFVVNVALPSIQRSLDATPSELEWVVAGYGLTFAAFLITAGRLGDHVGRRRMLSIGLAAFFATSAACALAPSAAAIVVARTAQGVAGAILLPNILSIVGVVFHGRDRVRALSVYGVVMGIAGGGGQLIGGLLIHLDVAGLGWRTVFLVNLPVALVALVLVPRLLPETRAERPAGIDLAGMALAALSLVALVLPLVEGRQAGWPLWTWGSLAAAPLLLSAFVAWEVRLRRSGSSPLLDVGLLQVAAFRAGTGTALLQWCGQASFYLVVALYLQDGRGLDALHAGLLFTFLAVAFLIASMVGPRLGAGFGRAVVGAGALVIVLGDAALLGAIAFGGSGSILLLAPGLAIVGAGQGLSLTPLTGMVLMHADSRRAGEVSGTLSTMQQVGNALGVAVVGAVFFGGLDAGHGVAFGRSLVVLMAILLATGAVTRLLPAPRPAFVKETAT